MQIPDFLANLRRVIKLHESMLKQICETHALTLTEATVISFLHNNPGKDTAGDIVELRMLSKGNVSQAVEGLIQKSLLQRVPDTADRRKIHLLLLPAARPITDEIDRCRGQFCGEVFCGFSDEERAQFHSYTRRMMENTMAAMKRRETNDER